MHIDIGYFTHLSLIFFVAHLLSLNFIYPKNDKVKFLFCQTFLQIVPFNVFSDFI